jgi:hypothetical protein
MTNRLARSEDSASINMYSLMDGFRRVLDRPKSPALLFSFAHALDNLVPYNLVLTDSLDAIKEWKPKTVYLTNIGEYIAYRSTTKSYKASLFSTDATIRSEALKTRLSRWDGKYNSQLSNAVIEIISKRGQTGPLPRLDLTKQNSYAVMNFQLWIYILRVRLQSELSKPNPSIWFSGTKLLTYGATQAYRRLSRCMDSNVAKIIVEFLPDYNHIDHLLTQLDIFQNYLRAVAKISEISYQFDKYLNDFDDRVFPIVENRLVENLKNAKPWSDALFSSIKKMEESDVSMAVYIPLQKGLEYLLGKSQPLKIPQSLIDSHLSIRKPLATLHPKSNEFQSAKSNNQNSSSCAYAAAITHFTAHATQLANKKPVVKADKENVDTLRLIIMLLQNTKFGWQRGPFKIPGALFKGRLKAIAQPYKQLLLEAASGNQNPRAVCSSKSF